jgi:DNA ligase-1
MTTKPTKPMKAFSENPDIAKIRYPVLASAKMDGFRCYKPGDFALSCSNKPIRNDFTREWIEKHLPHGPDGELTVKGGNFNSCQSAFTTKAGEPDFQYNLFDLCVDVGEQFQDRYEALVAYYASHARDPAFVSRVKVIEHILIRSPEEFLRFFEKCLDDGFEGAMMRSLDGPYKCGRTTLREGWLFKYKDWVDTEGRILSLEEGTTNTNEATVNELGHSQRSSCKAGMVPSGTLGKFVVENLETGVVHKIGTGKDLDDVLRQEIWDNREKYVGRVITYKYQACGTLVRPRLPIWKGFRDEEDISE